MCDLFPTKEQRGGGTVPSRSYISRFPLAFLEVKVQDSYSLFAFPGSFLLVVVGQADLEELERRVVAKRSNESYLKKES